MRFQVSDPLYNEYMEVPLMPSYPLTPSYALVDERMILYFCDGPIQRAQHCIDCVSLLNQ